MDLFRVFDWDGASLGADRGGPLHVPRAFQGAGRHDAPASYGAWYCSRQAISAVAECLQYLRGHRLENADFRRTGDMVKALVGLSLRDEESALVDLDDPGSLLSRGLRPSGVATLQRPVTQLLARSIFEEGADGLQWWSTLEAGWTNATLFHERVLPKISIREAPRKLRVALPEVREAAAHLGIRV